MTGKKYKKALIKNRQAKFLPFLRFGENFFALENSYKVFDEQSKILYDEQIEKKKAKRKKIINICTFALNIIILATILIIQLSKDAGSVTNISVNWKYIALVAGFVGALILIDSAKIFVMIKASTKKSRPFLAYKTSALGRYYDSITPMSTGGQPFQIFYMNKRGIRGDVATGIPLVKYIMWQITYVFICTFVMIYNGIKYGSTANTVITIVAWVAILANLAIFLTVVLLSVSKKFGPRIVIGILKLLAKMHIVKNYQKTFRKVMRFVLNYQKTFKTLLKKPLVLILQFFLAAFDIILYNIIPFIICLAFVSKAEMTAHNITIFTTFIQSIICSLSLAFVPTPGSSGGAEGIFALVFGGLFEKSGLFWPLLVWRIASYYIYLIQGLLVLVYDFFVGNKKAERLKQAGAEIYNEQIKTTFKETLKQNLRTIEVVQTQEQDKLPTMAFTEIDKPRKNAKEIIENSQLVTDEELSKNTKDVDLILLEDRLRNQERKERRQKQQIKRKRHKK